MHLRDEAILPEGVDERGEGADGGDAARGVVFDPLGLLETRDAGDDVGGGGTE